VAYYTQNDIFLAVDTLREYEAQPHGSIFIEEWAYIYRFIRHHKIKSIIEIGSWYHVSSLALLTGLSHNRRGKRKLISIDLNFPRKLEFNGPGVEWQKIKGSSFDIIPSLDEKVDMCFIDGAHGADAVKQDVINCQEKLNDNGFLLIHDINYQPTYNGISELLDIDKCLIWTPQPDKFHGLLIYSKS